MRLKVELKEVNSAYRSSSRRWFLVNEDVRTVNDLQKQVRHEFQLGDQDVLLSMQGFDLQPETPISLLQNDDTVLVFAESPSQAKEPAVPQLAQWQTGSKRKAQLFEAGKADKSMAETREKKRKSRGVIESNQQGNAALGESHSDKDNNLSSQSHGRRRKRRKSVKQTTSSKRGTPCNPGPHLAAADSPASTSSPCSTPQEGSTEIARPSSPLQSSEAPASIGLPSGKAPDSGSDDVSGTSSSSSSSAVKDSSSETSAEPLGRPSDEEHYRQPYRTPKKVADNGPSCAVNGSLTGSHKQSRNARRKKHRRRLVRQGILPARIKSSRRRVPIMENLPCIQPAELPKRGDALPLEATEFQQTGTYIRFSSSDEDEGAQPLEHSLGRLEGHTVAQPDVSTRLVSAIELALENDFPHGDPKSFPALQNVPCVGTIVAYRLLELTPLGPEESEWRYGKALESYSEQTVVLEPWPDFNEHPVRPKRRDDGNTTASNDWADSITSDDDGGNSPYDENGILTTPIYSFTQLRTVAPDTTVRRCVVANQLPDQQKHPLQKASEHATPKVPGTITGATGSRETAKALVKGQPKKQQVSLAQHMVPRALHTSIRHKEIEGVGEAHPPGMSYLQAQTPASANPPTNQQSPEPNTSVTVTPSNANGHTSTPAGWSGGVVRIRPLRRIRREASGTPGACSEYVNPDDSGDAAPPKPNQSTTPGGTSLSGHYEIAEALAKRKAEIAESLKKRA